MSYRSKRFTFGSKTTTEINAITTVTNPELSAGMSVWNSDIKKPEYWTGSIWTNEDCIVGTNVGGVTMIQGKLIRTSPSSGGLVLSNNTSGFEDYLVGVVWRGGAIGGEVVVAVQGLYPCRIWTSDTNSTRGSLIE